MCQKKVGLSVLCVVLILARPPLGPGGAPPLGPGGALPGSWWRPGGALALALEGPLPGPWREALAPAGALRGPWALGGPYKL